MRSPFCYPPPPPPFLQAQRASRADAPALTKMRRLRRRRRRRQYMGERGRAKCAAEFNWDRIAGQTEAVYLDGP